MVYGTDTIICRPERLDLATSDTVVAEKTHDLAVCAFWRPKKHGISGRMSFVLPDGRKKP